MSKINTLKELVNTINKNYKYNSANIEYLEKIINRYNGIDWKEYIKISNNYDKELIYKNNNYGLFAITWMPHSKSQIHDHTDNGCLFKILDGELVEDWYSNNTIKFITRNYYNKNDISFISNNKCLHKIMNQTNNNSISLHLYSPFLYYPNYYINNII